MEKDLEKDSIKDKFPLVIPLFTDAAINIELNSNNVSWLHVTARSRCRKVLPDFISFKIFNQLQIFTPGKSYVRSYFWNMQFLQRFTVFL